MIDKANELLLTARVLVGSITAILLSVTEESTFDAVAVAARQESILTQRFVGEQQRLHLALLVFHFAVFHGIFPVAGLLLDVEKQTGWTANSL